MDYAKSKEIIHQTSILSEADTAFIDESIGKIQANWDKNQRYRTETEMRMSVLNDTRFPTHAAKYWQCVREQSSFYENLVGTSFNYRRCKLKQAKIQRKIDKCTDDLKLQGLQIDLEEQQFREINLAAEAKDRVRELRLWDQIMAEHRAADPTFDSEDVNQHQLVSYRLRFEQQMKAVNENTPMGERNNLVGQARTADRLLQERGMLQKQEDGTFALRWQQ